MCMASCMIRLALVLSTLAAAVHGHILSTTLAKAKAGEWVGLEGSEDESMIKVIKSNKVAGERYFAFETGEDYCRREGAHLVSIRNKDEQEFVAELVLKVRNSEETDKSVFIMTGAQTQYVAWFDGSPVDYIQKQISEKNERMCYYIYALGNTEARSEEWAPAYCSRFPLVDNSYVVCRK